MLPKLRKNSNSNFVAVKSPTGNELVEDRDCAEPTKRLSKEQLEEIVREAFPIEKTTIPAPPDYETF